MSREKGGASGVEGGSERVRSLAAPDPLSTLNSRVSTRTRRSPSVNAAEITEEFARLANGALAHPHEAEVKFDWWIAGSSTQVALGGITVAYLTYYRRVISSRAVGEAFLPLKGMFEKKYFLDVIYEEIFVKTLFQRGWNRLLELNDRYVVDGVVNGTGKVTRFVSGRLQVIQTGQLQAYGAMVVAGVIVIVIAVYTANPL